MTEIRVGAEVDVITDADISSLRTVQGSYVSRCMPTHRTPKPLETLG